MAKRKNKPPKTKPSKVAFVLDNNLSESDRRIASELLGHELGGTLAIMDNGDIVMID